MGCVKFYCDILGKFSTKRFLLNRRIIMLNNPYPPLINSIVMIPYEETQLTTYSRNQKTLEKKDNFYACVVTLNSPMHTRHGILECKTHLT